MLLRSGLTVKKLQWNDPEIAGVSTSNPPGNYFGDEPLVTDRELIDRIFSRDKVAIKLIYERYSSLIISVALRVLHDPLDAEDVLQEVFLQVWRTPPHLRVGSNRLLHG